MIKKFFTFSIMVLFVFLAIFQLKAQDNFDPGALINLLQQQQNNSNSPVPTMPNVDLKQIQAIFSNPQIQKLLTSGKFANIVDREKLMKILKSGGIKSLQNPQVLMSIINKEELLKLASDPEIQNLMSSEAIAPLLQMLKGMSPSNGLNLENTNIDNLIPPESQEKLEELKGMLQNGNIEQNFKNVEMLQQLLNEDGN